jgi:uncharacterized membrane protein
MQNHSPTQRNIKEICAIEEAALSRRSLAVRISDVIATQAGRMWFIICHVVWFAIWIGLNWERRSAGAFDPFPFSLLTMIVSLESIFLSLFILMSQNRSAHHADRRYHLDLQINLLAENENTQVLRMLRALCKYHKLAIAGDPEIKALAERTEIQSVLTELKDSLPPDPDDREG